MIEPATLQAMAAVGAMLTAAFAAIGGWVYWLHRDTEHRLRDTERRLTERMDRMEERLTEQMNRMEERLTEQMNRNHREILTLLEGHVHADGTPAVFRRLAPADDAS